MVAWKRHPKPVELHRNVRAPMPKGRILGIRDPDIPVDLPAFWQYINTMVESRLEDTSLGYYLLDVSLSTAKKPPKMQ